MARAVFLDRDGVLNEVVYSPDLGVVDSPLNPDQFVLLPRVGEALRGLHNLGFKVVLVSNQPEVAKGKMSLELFEAVREKMAVELWRQGVRLDGEYYCLHHPEAKLPEYRVECDCRKPKPGLLLRAAEEMDLTLSDSYMVGDGLMDVEAGSRAGCVTFLVGNRRCDLCRIMAETGFEPDYVVPSLLDAARIIRERKGDL